MKIAVAAESDAGEPQVAATPVTIKDWSLSSLKEKPIKIGAPTRRCLSETTFVVQTPPAAAAVRRYRCTANMNLICMCWLRGAGTAKTGRDRSRSRNEGPRKLCRYSHA